MKKVRLSSVIAAVRIDSAILISEDRWDQWQAQFLKSLNGAFGGEAKFVNHDWQENQDLYFLTFKDTSGKLDQPFLMLAFADSTKTGMKYEFVSACAVTTVNIPKKGIQTYAFAHSSAKVSDGRGNSGDLVNNSNELIECYRFTVLGDPEQLKAEAAIAAEVQSLLKNKMGSSFTDRRVRGLTTVTNIYEVVGRAPANWKDKLVSIFQSEPGYKIRQMPHVYFEVYAKNDPSWVILFDMHKFNFFIEKVK